MCTLGCELNAHVYECARARVCFARTCVFCAHARARACVCVCVCVCVCLRACARALEGVWCLCALVAPNEESECPLVTSRDRSIIPPQQTRNAESVERLSRSRQGDELETAKREFAKKCLPPALAADAAGESGQRTDDGASVVAIITYLGQLLTAYRDKPALVASCLRCVCMLAYMRTWSACS